MDESTLKEPNVEVTNSYVRKNYQVQMLDSFPDPIGSNTLSLIDELGNGGLHSKLYPPPLEFNCTYGGPSLPVMLSEKRYK